jgi:hypothetical protein
MGIILVIQGLITLSSRIFTTIFSSQQKHLIVKGTNIPDPILRNLENIRITNLHIMLLNLVSYVEEIILSDAIALCKPCHPLIVETF